MKTLKNKIAAITIAIFFILSMTASTILVPNANAHTPPINVPTNAYVSCAPPVIGLGQYTTIVVWLDRFSPTSTGTSGERWAGFLITITQPDGTNITIGPWSCASAVASDFKTFTPTQLGNYSIVFSFPGANVTAGAQPNPVAAYAADIGDVFLPSTSKPCTLTVQQTAVPNFPEGPLPTGYWTLPITGLNRGWTVLASNWLQGSWLVNNFQTVGTAPTSAHVLWANPITPAYPGGIADANYPTLDANSEDYNSPWGGCIIMNGIIYYNTPATAQTQRYGYYAVNLYTGQQIWYNNGTNPITMGTNAFGGPQPLTAQTYPHLTLGQMFEYNSVNGRGILSYLWEQGPAAPGTTPGSTTWYMLDASTGNLILTLVNVPGGTAAEDQQGDLLIYSYNSATGNLLCWNSTQAILPGGPIGTAQQQWRPPQGAVIDAVNDTLWLAGPWDVTLDAPSIAALQQPLSGYTMNVTVPTGLPGSMTILKNDAREPVEIFGSAFTTVYAGVGGTIIGDQFTVWLLSINEHATSYSPWPTLDCTLNNNLGFTATLNYEKTITVPLSGKNYTWSIGGINYDSGVFILRCAQTSQIWGYSLTTGALLWGPTPAMSADNQMEYYSQSSSIYYGMVLCTASYAGTITAYNATTGQQLWMYNATAAPYSYESAYGANMPISIGAVCNGMIYTYSNEHSPTNPLWRQSYTRCINVTDGTLIWKLSTYMDFIGTPPAIADGYLVTASDYDNLIYCIGKGPSATTVEAPQSGITMGSSFTITGTVTDQSPGALAYATKYGDVNGVACVSDANQEAWMEYLYEQQAMPTNITGVPVTLTAIDPNGNYINLGTATNDLNGVYGLQVNPTMLSAGPGLYKVIATFAGSNSYGSSYTDSFFTVNAAPTVAPTATPQSNLATAADLMTYIVAAAIAIIIAIAIVGFLILRKHP
jgi:hypothetical protein